MVAREPWHVRAKKHAVVFAGAATLSVAGFAALSTPTGPQDKPSVVADSQADIITASLDGGQVTRTSRSSSERAPLSSAVKAEAKVEGTRFAKRSLQVRADASAKSPVLATVAKGKKVQITGAVRDGWTQIIHNDLPRWVSTQHLGRSAPKPKKKSVTVSGAPCRLGSGVEAGLAPDTVRVYRAVCAKFSQITSYGGTSGSGEHASGQALDIMVSGELGRQVAQFLQDNRQRLGISYLIYEQKIWTVQRAGEGWRPMTDRGSATANHYDHVHVTTYGSAGSN